MFVSYAIPNNHNHHATPEKAPASTPLTYVKLASGDIFGLWKQTSSYFNLKASIISSMFVENGEGAVVSRGITR